MALDSQIKNLALAIRQQESGGKYDTRGASGEYGAFQFLPTTWSAQSKKYGVNVPLDQATPNDQNKVAYNYVKELADKGYKPSQIAAAWNAGEGSLKDDAWKTNVGTNSLGVHYDTPSYVSNVAKYYKEFSAKNPSVTQPASLDSAQPPEPSFGRKLLNFAGDVTGQRGLGEDIGGGIADISNNNLYEQVVQQHETILTQLRDKIAEKEQKGEDASRLKNVLAATEDETPNKNDFLSGVQNKTTLQILGDIGSSALGIGGGAMIPGAGGVGARLAGVTGLGAGLGFTGGLGAGETNVGDLASSTAMGAGAAFLTGGILEGAGALFRNGGQIISKLGGKTAEQVLATPESELSSLSAKERSFYNQNKNAKINEEFKVKEAKIKEELVKAKEQAKVDLKKAADDFHNATQKEAVKVQDKVLEHMGDANKKYGKLLEEALAPVEDVPVSNKGLNDFINTKYAENPEQAKVVKELFGINEADFITAKNGVTEAQDTTIGELYNRVRELKSEVGKAGKSGSRALTADEYVKSKAVDDLMSFLHQEADGTEFSKTLEEANKIWREWAPTRDRIFSELKPFDMSGNKKISFPNTLKRVASGKGAIQDVNFIQTLEDMIGSPIGKESKAAFAKLDAEKQAQVVSKLQADTKILENRLAKQAAKEDWSFKKFEAERKAGKREMIKKIVKWAAGLVVTGELVKHGVDLVP